MSIKSYFVLGKEWHSLHFSTKWICGLEAYIYLFDEQNHWEISFVSSSFDVMQHFYLNSTDYNQLYPHLIKTIC